MLKCPFCRENYVEGQTFCKNPECFRELPQITSVPKETTLESESVDASSLFGAGPSNSTPEQLESPAPTGSVWDEPIAQPGWSKPDPEPISAGLGAAPPVPNSFMPTIHVQGPPTPGQMTPNPVAPVPGSLGSGPATPGPTGNTSAEVPPVPSWAAQSQDSTTAWAPPGPSPAADEPKVAGHVAPADATTWPPENTDTRRDPPPAPPIPPAGAAPPTGQGSRPDDQATGWPSQGSQAGGPGAAASEKARTSWGQQLSDSQSIVGQPPASPGNPPVLPSGSVGAAIMRNCAKCTHPNPLDARICGRCNSPLLMPCPNCQQEIKADSKRCTKCKYWLDQRDGPPNGSTPYRGQPHRTPDVPPPTDYVLVMTALDGTSELRYRLKEGANEVGAQSPGEGIIPDVDLDVLDRERQVISRRHACIHVQQGMIRVQNHAPINKTAVDGHVLPDQGMAEMRRGSRIRFADYNGRVE